METLILKILYDKIEKNQSVALVTLIESSELKRKVIALQYQIKLVHWEEQFLEL